MDGIVSDYSTAAGSSGGQKRKGVTPMRVSDTISMVSQPAIYRSQEQVKRCCSCTSHSTCSTKETPEWACGCLKAGRYFTGYYCWNKCRNKGWLMPSPATARGLLGHFVCSADSPIVCQPTSTPPVRVPISSSLPVISGASGRGSWGRAGRQRSPWEGGRGGGGCHGGMPGTERGILTPKNQDRRIGGRHG